MKDTSIGGALSALGTALIAASLTAACGSESEHWDETAAPTIVAQRSPEVTHGDWGELLVDAGDGAAAAQDVASRSFADWEELAAFARKQLNAEIIRSESGKVLSIRGTSTVLGRVTYRDVEGGGGFAAKDFVSAFLGGARGILTIGNDELRVADEARIVRDGQISQALLTEESEVCDGSDCIAGDSWVTHYPFYHNVGSETEQTSGGYSPHYYSCCPTGTTRVVVDGRTHCRKYQPLRDRFGNPILDARGKPILNRNSYVEFATRTCSYQVRNNRLDVRAPAHYGAPPAGEWSKTATNVSKVSVGMWELVKRIDVNHNSDIEGDYVEDVEVHYLKDITGICGYRSGTRGGSTATGDGFLGENEFLCGYQDGPVVMRF